MSRIVLQLRVGATRDRGFVFRTCVRPPATITVGRARSAMLPIDDPGAPEAHPLFNAGPTDCLLDCRLDWDLVMYSDEGTLRAEELLAAGLAIRSGQRLLMRIARGSRGSVAIGGVRLLFKWEAVPEEPIGDVPLRDVGDVPRCHACGLALRDALPREGLLARCDSCRALSRFVDPDGPYRPLARPAALPSVGRQAQPPPESSQAIPTVEEESDTLLSVPIFAPLTRHNLPVLPQHAQPAGRPGRDETPAAVRVAKNPIVAVEQMQTVLSKSPFVHRERVPRPESDAGEPRGPEPGLDSLLDQAFYGAEVEAMELLPPPGPTDADTPIAWSTMSVLSARSEYGAGEGRIPRPEVARALRSAAREVLEPVASRVPLVGALVGVLLLATGVAVVASRGKGTTPAPADPALPMVAAPLPPTAIDPSAPRWVPTKAASPRSRVDHPAATYVKFLPGDPTPVSVRVEAFGLDRFEVTVADFERFVRATGSRPPDAWLTSPPPPGSALPATSIPIDEARRFCRWSEGRLPAEAEWERAAAGTYGRSFPWGNSFQPSMVAAGSWVVGVGSHPDGASESGVQDLVGNAVEWVEPRVGEAPFLKGGGAGTFSAAEHLMVFTRIDPESAAWSPGPGFRCAYSGQ